MSITRGRIRLALDVGSSRPIRDQISGSAPDCFRGEDISVELGLFYGSALTTIDNLSKIVLQVKEMDQLANPPLIEGEVLAAGFNGTLTLNDWNTQADQHATITLTAAETNVDLGGAAKKTFWLVIGAIRTGGERITLGVGTLTVYEDGWVGEGAYVPPPSAKVRVNGSGDLQLRDELTGLYHTLYIETVGTTKLLTINQTGEA